MKIEQRSEFGDKWTKNVEKRKREREERVLTWAGVQVLQVQALPQDVRRRLPHNLPRWPDKAEGATGREFITTHDMDMDKDLDTDMALDMNMGTGATRHPVRVRACRILFEARLISIMFNLVPNRINSFGKLKCTQRPHATPPPLTPSLRPSAAAFCLARMHA